MARHRLILPILLAAVMLGATAIIATTEVRYRVNLSSLLDMWGDVFRDTDNVGLTATQVSDRREMAMGAELAKAFAPYIVHDAKIQKYVDEVGIRLAAQRERKAITYRFRIISGQGINAFALPGGNIFVSRQMLEFAQSEAEIAAIIGHEISHVDLRHCIERFQYELLARRVLPSDLAALSRLPYQLLRVSYSKEQEREADMDGVIIAAKAGYHPKYGLALYDRMAALANESQTTGPPGSLTIEAGKAVGEAILDYFRSHPSFADRISVITGVLQRNASNWKERKFYVGRSNHVQRVSSTTQPLDAELRPYGEPPALAEYLLLKKDFKALAVHSASGLSGIAVDQTSASAAIQRALSECEKKIKPCQLYAVGDTIIANMSENEIDAAVAKYSAASYFARAIISWSKGANDQAIVDYSEAIRINPAFADAYNGRGDVWRSKGDIDRAITDYSEAIRINPAHAVAYYNRGNMWYTKGDFDRAIGDYIAVSKLGSKINWAGRLAAAYNARGWARYKRRDYELAMSDYDQAIQIDSKFALAYSNRGLIWRDYKKDNNRALADFDEAIRLNPSYPGAYLNCANIWRAEGDFQRAITGYTEAIQRNPNYALAYNNRGRARHDAGEFDRAILDFDAAIRLRPNYALAYRNRALARIAKREFDRAIFDSSEAIRLDGANGRHHLTRGLARFLSGNLLDAIGDLDQALVLNPKDAYAALWLHIVQKRSGHSSSLDRAIVDLDMAKWPAPVIYMFLGRLTPTTLLVLADHSDANIKRSQTCEANFYSGELALEAGDRTGAERHFRAAEDECPKTFYAWLAAHEELMQLGGAS